MNSYQRVLDEIRETEVVSLLRDLIKIPSVFIPDQTDGNHPALRPDHPEVLRRLVGDYKTKPCLNGKPGEGLGTEKQALFPMLRRAYERLNRRACLLILSLDFCRNKTLVCLDGGRRAVYLSSGVSFGQIWLKVNEVVGRGNN